MQRMGREYDSQELTGVREPLSWYDTYGAWATAGRLSPQWSRILLYRREAIETSSIDVVCAFSSVRVMLVSFQTGRGTCVSIQGRPDNFLFRASVIYRDRLLPVPRFYHTRPGAGTQTLAFILFLQALP